MKDWVYVIRTFYKDRGIKAVYIFLCSCITSIFYTTLNAVLPATIIYFVSRNNSFLQAMMKIVGITILTYLFRVIELYFDKKMECLIFLYRYNYIPLFSKEIFSWAQKDIDSVEGKAIIDQAYEAIYNGSNSGIGAVIDNSFQTFKYTLQTISLLLILGTISNKLILLIFVLNIAEYYIQAINNIWLTKNKMSENRITSYQNYFTRTLADKICKS